MGQADRGTVASSSARRAARWLVFFASRSAAAAAVIAALGRVTICDHTRNKLPSWVVIGEVDP